LFPERYKEYIAGSLIVAFAYAEKTPEKTESAVVAIFDVTDKGKVERFGAAAFPAVTVKEMKYMLRFPFGSFAAAG
jgi:hypothetical protein